MSMYRKVTIVKSRNANTNENNYTVERSYYIQLYTQSKLLTLKLKLRRYNHQPKYYLRTLIIHYLSRYF